MDKLASNSADFRLAIAPSDGTHLSYPAYMTGKYYSMLHHEPKEGGGIPEAQTTLAETLESAGFRCSLWSANEVFLALPGMAQGFRYSRVLGSHLAAAPIEGVVGTVRASYKPTGGPEFLYVHLMDVHLPYRPPSPHDRLFAPPYSDGRIADGALRDASGELLRSTRSFYGYDGSTYQGVLVEATDLHQLVALYDGAIHHVDEKLPELLDALKYNPQTDLLIVSADHGEQFYEHGFWGHTYSTLIEEIRVPLLIRGKDVQPGVRNEAVSLLDIFPTLCEMLGIRMPEGSVGRSLVPILRGAPQPQRSVVAEGYPKMGPKTTLVDGAYLYQVHTAVYRQLPDAPWPYRELLFDLREDPECAHDLAAKLPAKANELNARVREMNPLFEGCTPDIIRRNDARLQRGSNRLAQLETEPALVRKTGKPLIVPGTAANTGEEHELSFDYLMPAGTAWIKLQYRQSGKSFWSCRVWAPVPKWTHLSFVTVPEDSTEIEFVVSLQDSGEVQVRNLRYVEYSFPRVNLPYWGVQTDEAPEENGDADPERLKALGYL